MPGLITRTFRTDLADKFMDTFAEATGDRVYLFIGRVRDWTTSPPTPVDTFDDYNFDSWRSMIALKRITETDVHQVIPRYDWSSGTVYRVADITDSTTFNEPAASNTFYVVTSSDNVYKCLFNNGGAQSTIEPTGTSIGLTSTGDGYVWKFMYTISSADALSFKTTNWMPVQTLASDDTTTQWLVQQAAIEGSISIINVTDSGSNYLTADGNFSEVGLTLLKLDAGSTAAVDAYNDYSLLITSGPGVGQIKTITDYYSNNYVVIDSVFDTPVTTASRYLITPRVVIAGDGTNASGYSIVNDATNRLTSVAMLSVGSGYSYANVTIAGFTGSGGKAEALIAPPGGHGSNAVKELGGHNVMLTVTTSGDESGTFTVSNDFHKFGVIRNPLLASNGSVAQATTYEQTLKLDLLNVTSAARFEADERISASDDSTKTAHVVSFANTNVANTRGVLHLTSANGQSFALGTTITGATSGVTGQINSITNETLKKYTGDVLYVENRAGITRDLLQSEDFKIVIKF